MSEQHNNPLLQMLKESRKIAKYIIFAIKNKFLAEMLIWQTNND